ncbi:MAG: putative bifunctional diguanylate cyclase/phosphodiesterase [Solirubrobacteraceae bacterium]
MVGGSSTDVVDGLPVVDDARFALIARSGLGDGWRDADIDSWIEVLHANAGATLSAFCLDDRERWLLVSIYTGDGPRTPVEVARNGSLAKCLGGLCRPAVGTATPAYLEAPVIVEGQRLGHVCILAEPGHKWTTAQAGVLERIAAAVSAKVGLCVANVLVARERELVASHNRVHDLIARAAPLPEVLEEIAVSIERHDPSLLVSLVLLDRRSSTLHPGAGPSLPPHYLAAIDGVVIGPNVGSCGSAAWSGELTRADDIASDPKWAPIREFASAVQLAHCWSMPIKASDGDVLGTLAFYGRRPRQPLPEHIELLDEWARVAGIAIERHRTLERLVHDARHDGLTGLPNRTAIFETLEEAILRAGPRRQVAVLFVDLDGLKALNDTLGHDRADEMLREIADRLSGSIRTGDIVGRFGGDEFVVIAEDVASQDAAGQVGLRLLDVISQPLPGLDQHSVTASIGIALLDGTGVDAREAIRHADGAMYAAKRAGRDRCVFVEGKQRVRAGRRLVITRELRGAEMRAELRLVYQPVISLASRDLVAVETLVRWDSPRLGPVPPLEFIPIAEDTGTIIPIGAWVLRESCEAMTRIAGEHGRQLELAVNVSAHQLSNPDFAHWVEQTIAHAEFPADFLTLEITESALMRPTATTSRNLHDLAALGIRIALDDFGTGFSSLSWLKHHPLGAIKIDRSFITGLPGDGRDMAIVAAMIEMARALGCTVTAEGVETEEQLAALEKLRCERIQGFLIARPLPLADLHALLTE